MSTNLEEKIEVQSMINLNIAKISIQLQDKFGFSIHNETFRMSKSLNAIYAHNLYLNRGII